MNRRFWQAAALTAIILAGGCTSKELQTVRNMPIQHIDLNRVKDGSYKGSFTYGKFTYEVSVTVANHAINTIDLVMNRDTKHAKRAAEVVNHIVSEQRNDVDVISGATTTSKALLKAVENALAAGLEK